MTYVPAGACWSWQEWTPTILFLEIRAGRTQPGVGVSPGWLHDLHHFREQMMLARMMASNYFGQFHTHRDIILETLRQRDSQTGPALENNTHCYREISRKYSAFRPIMKSREKCDVQRDKTRKFRVNFLISGLIKWQNDILLSADQNYILIWSLIILITTPDYSLA